MLAEAPLFMASLGVHHEAILPEQWLRTHGRGDRRGLHGVFYAGLLDGLLGVAGMIKLLVMTGIIPENSLPPVRL